MGGTRDRPAHLSCPGEDPRTQQEKEETKQGKGRIASDASHVLEAALEQMDGIIAGTNTGVDISYGTCEPALASAASYMNPFPVLHLVEDLRLALEMLEHSQEESSPPEPDPRPHSCLHKGVVRGELAAAFRLTLHLAWAPIPPSSPAKYY